MEEHIARDEQLFVERLRTEYIKMHTFEQERDALIAEINIEKRDVKGYHGREILELLQNADDAYQKSIDLGEKPECELVVTIKYIDNVLTVTNTGTYFDGDGIKAIVQGNNSPKTGKYIGNKGTGFRSVLNWAKTVRIFSGNYNVEFSREIALKEFEQIKNEPQIKKQINKRRNLYLPMLALPVNIQKDKRSKNTTIEVEIDSQKLDDDYNVNRQIENIDLRILLFLPNISQIEIITAQSHVVYKRKISEDIIKTVLLQKIVDDCVETEETFYLFNRVIEKAIEEDNEKKDIILAIAVPENFDSLKSNNLYSFFPLLDTQSPFNCVLHASYSLGDHRNTVTNNASNKEIIKHQFKFLTDVANVFVKNNRHDIAYKILVPSNFQNEKWTFTAPLTKFELEDYYLTLLAEQRIFNTVNNENISIKDDLKMIDGDYPKLFCGEEFKGLLKPLNDSRIIAFIKSLASREQLNIYYTENEILNKINIVTNSWDVSQQVTVFLWWNNHYFSSLPNLLKKQNGKWLTYKEECFFLIGGFDGRGLPSWVKIPAMDKIYQKTLFDATETSPRFIKIKESGDENKIERIICQSNLYPTITFKYRDINSIISAVNSSVGVSRNKAIDFIKWLWCNYGNKEGWNPPGKTENSGLKYNFPCLGENGVKDSEKIYFGFEYNNELAEKLFDDSFGAFPAIDTFGVKESNQKDFVEFISKFGVKEYPAIEVMDIKLPVESYKKGCIQEIMNTCDMGSSTSCYCKYMLPYINGLQNLLNDLSTEDVIKWIYEDNKLYYCLSNPYSSDGKIMYCGNLQQYYRTYFGKVKNYILCVFNETTWIEIDGERYSPKQTLQNFRSRNNQKFEGLLPVIGIEMIEEISKKTGIAFEKIYEIIQLFSFADKITDLSSNEFYGVMLDIPNLEFSRSVELSKHIYRIIEQRTFIKQFEYSENKNKFFAQGKLLVNYHGELQYCFVRDSFLPSTKIINKKNYRIVEKGNRTNNENFVRVFGCKEYTNTYTVLKNSIVVSQANEQFQKYYNDFQKYARAYGENNENIERYGKALTITLVSSISISENNNTTHIEDEYMSIRDTVTNWYITVFGSNFNINAISEIVETIYSNIANTPGFESGKIGELFRVAEKETREFLIKKDFGTLNVIEDSYYKNEIRNSFVSAISKVASWYDTSKINVDFDNFSNINNIPKIIAILKTIKTDVDEFKKAGFVYNIDLISYFKIAVEEFVLKEKARFKDVLFTRAKTNKKLQQKFLKTVYRFENFHIFAEYEKSIYFDVEKLIISEFGEWRNEEYCSSEEEYSTNYKILNPKKQFEDELSNDLNVKTMIYFKMDHDFRNWLEQKNRCKTAVASQSESDQYIQYKNVIPTYKEISYSQNSFSNKVGDELRGTSKNVFTESDAIKRQRKQKILGNKGELLVYNYLCDKFGKENVYQRSEAFVEMDLLVAGQAISGDYDISYKDKDGKIHFVEVKTGSSHSFIISVKELQFAIEHANMYELFLVYDVDEKMPNITKLPKNFWEDKKFRRNDIIEKIEFHF